MWIQLDERDKNIMTPDVNSWLNTPDCKALGDNTIIQRLIELGAATSL